MKIKVTDLPYEKVMALPSGGYKPPVYQHLFFRWLLRTLSRPELKKVHFDLQKTDMEKVGSDQPCLVLMNHSSFLDLEIASCVLYPRQFHIVCTQDGFTGKENLMRMIGCIPARKFITDLTLVKDMVYALKDLRSDVLLFPEASYTFDGTATPLPDSLGKALKILKVPVVMIRTYGAFSRDPLYNGLQKREVDVRAEMKYLLSPEEIAQKSAAQLNAILKEAFTFDHFRWQQENHVKIRESFRADGLHRVLYKCPVCAAEGKTTGKGTTLTCSHCGSQWELTEEGFLTRIRGPEGTLDFTHVPDWYAWERNCVRDEIMSGSYLMDIPVEIMILKDTKAVYHVGDGRLVHDGSGFTLTGCDGKLSYHQSAKASYSLYSDYFWYEIGDMISIGTMQIQYYCFPKDISYTPEKEGDWKPGEALVAKARLAAEEMYRLAAR